MFRGLHHQIDNLERCFGVLIQLVRLFCLVRRTRAENKFEFHSLHILIIKSCFTLNIAYAMRMSAKMPTVIESM